MKLHLSLDSKALKRTALFSLLLFFAAHAFCFFNLTYSGASVMLDVSKSRTAQIESGSFLLPYYFRLRGMLSAPLWVGMLSALYLMLTAAVSAWLLRLQKPSHLFILCGAMTVNAALTSIFAASLHTADSMMLALLLCSLSACCCLRLRLGVVPGTALLCAALALDPGSLAFFATLTLIVLISDLLSSKDNLQLSRALQALLCAAASFAVWFACSLFMAKRNGIALNVMPHMPAEGFFSAYLVPVRALLAPLTAYAVLSRALRALLWIACLAAVVCHANQLGKKRILLVLLCTLLLPLACTLPLFYVQSTAQITAAYCLLDVMTLTILARLLPDRFRLHNPAAAAFCALFLGNIVFSNQVYLKKNLEFESTLSLTSRIIQRMEETEGYRPGFTPVAIIGSPEASAFSVERKGFEHLSKLDAARSNYAVTSENEMLWYCWEILGYPSNFVSTFELDKLKELEAVKNMPVFPAEGCCAFVGDTLVLKLN